MTVKDQLKILDNKIRQNQADYDLYRKNAKISALSSGTLNKYEYLTGEDLGYRPDPVQKAKFEYSPSGQVFKKGLTTDEKSESLLKRLKNIEDNTDNQLIAIENNIGNQPAIKDGINNQPSIKDQKISDTKKFKFRDANGNKIKELNYLIDYIENSIEIYIEGKIFSIQARSKKAEIPVYKYYNFSDYSDLWSLVKKIFEGKLSIKEARKQQNAIEKKITELHNRLNYSGLRKGIHQQKKTLEDLYSNAKNLYIIKEDIINEMFNTEDDIATGGDDGRRKSVIETISKFGDE